MSIDTARQILEASKQRARELRSPVSIAIVDAGGHLVLFERMMSPYGWATGNISIAKANTAVMFNQSTDAVAQWGSAIPGFASSMATMTEGKFVMAAGGWPIRSGGITIGGIGVSGGNAPGRDDEIARAGLVALESGTSTSSVQPAQSAQPISDSSQPMPQSTEPTVPATPSYANPPSSYLDPASSMPLTNRATLQNDFPNQPASSRDLPPEQGDPYGDDSLNQFDADRSGGQS